MFDTENFLRWLKEMEESTRNHKDDYFAGAAKTYQIIIELINLGTFRKK
jgi:hypothetical protein